MFFGGFGGFRALFSDSLGFFTSIALGFVPKDPNWSGNGPKQNFPIFHKKTRNIKDKHRKNKEKHKKRQKNVAKHSFSIFSRGAPAAVKSPRGQDPFQGDLL